MKPASFLGKGARDLLRAVAGMAIILLIPALVFAAGVYAEGDKARTQGWKYLIPTYETIAELTQLAGMIGFVLPVLFFDESQVRMALLAGIGSILVVGVFIPIQIDRYAESKNRKKIFAWAAVDSEGSE